MQAIADHYLLNAKLHKFLLQVKKVFSSQYSERCISEGQLNEIYFTVFA